MIVGLLTPTGELEAATGYSRVEVSEGTPAVFPDLTRPCVVTAWFTEADGVRVVHDLDEPMGFIACSTPFIYDGTLYRGLSAEATIHLKGGMSVGMG